MKHYDSLTNKKILLLQGPIGYFFQELEDRLIENNNKVFRMLFNGGDEFFSKSKNSFIFDQKIEEWEDYLITLIEIYEIDHILLFGDSRIYHKTAIKIAKKLGLEVFVFEEGYLRPNFITLEIKGVNDNSVTIPKSKNIFNMMHFEYNYKTNIHRNKATIKHSYFISGLLGFIYYFISNLKLYKFKYYIHHRNINLFKEIFFQTLSFIRKTRFAITQEKLVEDLIEKKYGNYFLVPLQLYFDSQITEHSKYNNINEFIEEVLKSFAQNSVETDKIVFKHHPLGVGYSSYTQIIKKLSKELGIEKRVFYIHNGNSPELIKSSIGVVLINSTVGISAIYHLKPVKVMGKSIYNIDGITNKNTSLDKFWLLKKEPKEALVSNFLNYLYIETQLNGNFYIQNNIINNN